MISIRSCHKEKMYGLKDIPALIYFSFSTLKIMSENFLNPCPNKHFIIIDKPKKIASCLLLYVIFSFL